MNEMRGHVGLDHPLARYFKGHVIPGDAEDGPRWVTHFDGVGVYARSELCKFSGDFKIRCTFSTTSAADYMPLVYDEGDASIVFQVHNGRLRAYLTDSVGSVSVPILSDIVNDGLRREATLERKGSKLYVRVDEVIVGSEDCTTDPVTMQFYGKAWTRFFKGQLTVKAFDSSLPPDDQLVRDYRFDRKDGVLRNYAPSGALGSNLVDLDTMYVNAADNLVRAGDKVTWVNHTTWGQYQFRMPIVLKPGRSYLLKTHMTNAGRVALTFPTAETTTPAGWVANGYYGCFKDVGNGEQITVVTIPADADVIGSKLAIAPSLSTYNDLEATVTQLELVEAEGWGLMHNLAADSVKRYRLENDGDLIGVDNLWSGSPVMGSQWSESNGKYFLAGDGNYNALSESGLFEAGDHIRVGFQLSEFSGVGGFKAHCGNNLLVATSEDDTYSVDGVAGSTQLSFARQNPGEVVSCAISNIKVQRRFPASALYKLRSKIKDRLKNAAGKVRVIPRFDGVDMHGKILAWTASGDFEVQSALPIRSTESGYILAGPTDRIAQHAGFLYLGKVNAGDQQNAIPFGLEGLNALKVYRVGASSRSLVDGELLTLNGGASYAGDFTIDRIGTKWDNPTGVTNFDGHIQYVALIDLENPLTNSRLYLMDDATGILYDALSEKGSELINLDQGVFLSSASVVGKEIHIQGNTGAYKGDYYIFVDVEPKTEYVITAEQDGDSPYIEFQEYSGSTYLGNRNLGALTTDVTATRVRIKLSRTTVDAGLAVFRNLSIQKHVNAGQIHNAPADAYPKFVYQGVHAKKWLSPELVDTTAGPMTLTTASAWATIKVPLKDAVLREGSEFLVEFDADNREAYPVAFYVKGTNGGSVSQGRNSIVVTAGSSTTTDSIIFGASTADTTISNLSIRERLKESI